MTSLEIARRAGVSQATVSRVLNGHDTVTVEMRKRVLDAIAGTNFVLNAHAKAMRTSRSGSIGLVTSTIQNPFFPYLLDELTRELHEHGANAVVWNDSRKSAAEALTSGVVDGLIFTALRDDSEEVASLTSAGAPVVLCNRAPLRSATDVVMVDHEECARAAARYLLRFSRREIAAIFGNPEKFVTPLRERGFRSTLDEAGCPLSESRVRHGEISYDAGFAAANSLLDNGERFDALFCSSDIIAFGALNALRARGLSVPDDVWVVGVDGLPMSTWHNFDLTTLEQPVGEIAKRAVERLLSRINGEKSAAATDLLPPKLAVRSSTANAR